MHALPSGCAQPLPKVEDADQLSRTKEARKFCPSIAARAVCVKLRKRKRTGHRARIP
jgi:hypothetical protein